MLGVTFDGLASHPGEGGGGGVEILLVASCYRNRDKLWPQARYRDGLQLARMQTLPYPLHSGKTKSATRNIQTTLFVKLNGLKEEHYSNKIMPQKTQNAH